MEGLELYISNCWEAGLPCLDSTIFSENLDMIKISATGTKAMPRIGQERWALGKLIGKKQSAGGKLNSSRIEKAVKLILRERTINIITTTKLFCHSHAEQKWCNQSQYERIPQSKLQYAKTQLWRVLDNINHVKHRSSSSSSSSKGQNLTAVLL